jgi:hypothetical protein
VHRLLLKDIWRGFHLFLDHRLHVLGFFGLFRCHWNKELLSQTEARMTHFVILTVPPPRTNHSLMHNSTRGMSPSQKDLQVRFRENVSFGPFSWVIAHDFQHSGQFFSTSRMCTDSLYKIFYDATIDFWTLGYTFRVFFGPFRCTWNRELLAQTETRTMHFITLTVPPPGTDHSLIHNSTRSMSPGQKDLQAHFRENVRFRPFSLVIAHDFQHSGQFFCNLPDVHRLLVDDIW